MKDNEKHLLQIHGILPEFDIISQTTLKDFMDTYESVANTSDNVNELSKISNLLTKNETEIPGYGDNLKSEHQDNPELNKVAYAIIEFMMKKTSDPTDWSYLLMYIMSKLNLELDDSDELDLDE
jgi:hypothetical protein